MKFMRNKKTGLIALCIILGVILGFVLTGCGKTEQQSQTTPQQQGAKSDQISKDNPLVVDKAAKTVKVYSEVNGKYFVEPTRHGIVFKDGSNGDKSILKAWANQNDFYNALIEIGAKPGNNVTLETTDKTVEGSQLEVFVSWEGKDVPFEEIYTDSQNKKIDIRFGGNQERAADKKTGCILCLDSCPVGITSNAAHPQNSFANKKVEFKGNKDVLPADGKSVIVTFKLK